MFEEPRFGQNALLETISCFLVLSIDFLKSHFCFHRLSSSLNLNSLACSPHNGNAVQAGAACRMCIWCSAKFTNVSYTPSRTKPNMKALILLTVHDHWRRSCFLLWRCNQGTQFQHKVTHNSLLREQGWRMETRA
jgi:hypothetical protein